MGLRSDYRYQAVRLLGLICLLGILLAPVRTRAQVAGATLTGTIADPTGAVIPQAQVSIRNTATGVVTAVQADTDGLYTAPNLVPGSYEVTVSVPGFVTQVLPGITLTVGAQQVLNVKMQVGQATQRVEVTGQASAVQLATSSISAVVSSTTVRELPLNGRSWTDLASLQPGVGAIQTQPPFTIGADRGNRGFGSEVSISGARPQQNNYRLDGISMNDYANGGPGSVLGGNLGVDAIQEFSVLTTNYSAEYGKTAGGVVNAITKSGTNQFHGSVYEFLRNNALDARNFFDPESIPAFRRNQFGGAAGGPIQKDRTFIFGDYEGIRQSKGISALDTVPSVAARAGNLCSAPSGNPPSCTPTTVLVDPSAQKYFVFFPLPNGGLVPGGNGDTGFFSYVGNQAVSENFFTSRADHKFSDKDSMFGSFMYDKTNFSAPGQMNQVLLGSLTLRLLLTLEETHVFRPNLVNTVRGGFNRESADDDVSAAAINPAAADLALGSQPGRAAAQVFISGVPPGFTGGVGANPTYLYRWNSFQGYDDAFYTRGTHSVKFGAVVERMQLNDLPLSNPNGVFNFASLTAFLTNQPKKYNSGIASTLQPRGYRYTLFGAYIQDDWHWRPNVTLNLGLRYETITVPTEVQGRLAHLNTLTDATPTLGSPFFHNPTKRNFAPRVGFAWDPFSNGKTAVRAGFGLFDSLPLPYEFTLLDHLAAPFFAIGAVGGKNLPPGSFFQGAAQLLQPGTLRAAYVDQFPRRNYVMQWNFNIQQQLTPNLTALVGYVGARGVHMPYRVDDIDLSLPTLTSAGYLYPNPIGSGPRFNENFGQISGQFFKGNSFYDALEVGITKRMSRGLQLQGSFTWGKSIDNNSATVAGDQFSNAISSLNWFDPRLTRGLSDFNVGRTLVVSATWQLPELKSLSGPAGWLANGWELGGIFKANDGVPYTPTWATGGDPAGTNSADDYSYPNVLTGPGCESLVNPGNPNHYVKTQCFAVPTAPSAAFYSAAPPLGCDPSAGTHPQCFNLRGNAGRNILIGPGIQELDFSVFKNNYIRRISENFNIQFRAEFFNILNHANFGDPVIPNGEADLFDGSGAPIGSVGQLTTTSTTAREIQFALKVIW
jgi:Carboxypeptidase regulatory-like domain/TonB dependent receptor-like, beta-barrel/TonB-dependent Receptor Plug Domain